MTVTVSIPQEKPPPEPVVANGQNNGLLKTKCGVLRVVQIILGLLSSVLIRPRYQDSTIEYLFLFLTVNASLLTAVILWDSLSGGKLRKILLPDVSSDYWHRLELLYNGIIGLLFYLGSFGMLASFIGYYNPRTNILAGVLGMGACFAYGYGWWLMFRERAFKRLIENEIRKTGAAAAGERETVNDGGV